MNDKIIQKAKEHLKATFMHSCNIYEYAKNNTGSITKSERVLKHEKVKCQLSKVSAPPANAANAQSDYSAEAKLFICDNITISPGSEFDVFIGADETPVTYTCAGHPFVYATHQEIMLKKAGRA